MRVTAILICLGVVGGCGKPSPDARPAADPPVQFERVSTNRVIHGERIALVLGCAGCHREDLTGQDWSDPGFGQMWTANLTRTVPRLNDEQLAQVIRSGTRSDGSELWEMPSHLFTALTREDMSALIAYLRSRPPAGVNHPPPVFEEAARQEMAAGTFKSSAVQVKEEGRQWPPEAGQQHALGRYIVRATCAECHGMNLQGGQPNPSAKPRPDLRVVVPAYDDAAFATLLRTGKAIGGRDVGLMTGVAKGRYRHLTDVELRAVHRYLEAVGGE